MKKLILITIATLLLQGCVPALNKKLSMDAITYCKHKGTEIEYIKTQGGEVHPTFGCIGIDKVISVYEARTYLELEEAK